MEGRKRRLPRGFLIALRPDRPKGDTPLFECVFCHNGKPVFYLPTMKRLGAGTYEISGEAAAHYYTTHGLDPDSVVELFANALAKLAKRVKEETAPCMSGESSTDTGS